MAPRSLDELINTAESAWPLVQGWVAASPRTADVLPADPAVAAKTLVTMQVTTRVPLGTIAYHTGGLLLDHGWLRILGSGSSRMSGSLLSWNGLGNDPFPDVLAQAFLVAIDVVGGIFAINGGVFPGPMRNIFFFAPDALAWEDMGIGYTDFLHWALTGDTDEFYGCYRWPEWEHEVAALDGDQGISIYPPLLASGEPIGERHRKAISLREIVGVEWEMAKQLGST